MATKFLDADGGTDTYTTWADWVSYVQALSGLSSTEELLITSAREFNGGNAQLTGGTVSASTVNQIVIRPVSGKEWGGNLVYGSGARVLFDGANEQIFINWANTSISKIAFRKTTDTITTSLGMMTITGSIVVDVKDVLLETDQPSFVMFDDRAASASIRQNIIAIRASGGATRDGIRCANNAKTYRNCASISLTNQSSGAGFHQYGGVATWYNCYSFGYSTDFTSAYSTNSRFNATSKTAGAAGEAVPSSGAVFQLVSADFESANFAAPDFRVASGSTKLKDAGVTSGGSVFDIYSQAVSNSARDIGPFEFQGAPPPPPPAASNVYSYNPLGNLVVDLGGLRYY